MRTGLSLTFGLSDRLARAAEKRYCQNSAAIDRTLKKEDINSRVSQVEASHKDSQTNITLPVFPGWREAITASRIFSIGKIVPIAGKTIFRVERKRQISSR